MFHHPDPEHIWSGSDAIFRLNRLLAEQSFTKVIFMVDENTHQHCLPRILPELEELKDYEVLEVPAGEESKSPEVLVNLWYALSDLQVDRNALVINLGGGMITDLGGFVAGSYLRGLRFVNIPTSLLAMVDASVGGKNGINLDHQKNRVGLFLEPHATCIFPDFLETLPIKEKFSGFAEMLKHGLISSPQYWEECIKLDIEHASPPLELIMGSIYLKKQVVDQDFREQGLRKILNFGHSIGHAVETLSMRTSKPFSHGEAVVLGMMVEVLLSLELKMLRDGEADSILEKLSEYYPHLKLNFSVEDILAEMRSDKKNVGGELRLSLLRGIGQAEADVVLTEEQISHAIRSLLDIQKKAE